MKPLSLCECLSEVCVCVCVFQCQTGMYKYSIIQWRWHSAPWWQRKKQLAHETLVSCLSFWFYFASKPNAVPSVFSWAFTSPHPPPPSLKTKWNNTQFSLICLESTLPVTACLISFHELPPHHFFLPSPAWYAACSGQLPIGACGVLSHGNVLNTKPFFYFILTAPPLPSLDFITLWYLKALSILASPYERSIVFTVLYHTDFAKLHMTTSI